MEERRWKIAEGRSRMQSFNLSHGVSLRLTSRSRALPGNEIRNSKSALHNSPDPVLPEPLLQPLPAVLGLLFAVRRAVVGVKAVGRVGIKDDLGGLFGFL